MFTMQLVTQHFFAVFRVPCISALLSRYPIALVHAPPQLTMIFNISDATTAHSSSSSPSPLHSDDSCCSQALLPESGRGKDQLHGCYWSFTAGAILLPGVRQHIQGLQRLGAFSISLASGCLRHLVVKYLSEIPGLDQKPVPLYPGYFILLLSNANWLVCRITTDMSLDGTQTLGRLLLSIPALCPVDALPGSL